MNRRILIYLVNELNKQVYITSKAWPQLESDFRKVYKWANDVPLQIKKRQLRATIPHLGSDKHNGMLYCLNYPINNWTLNKFFKRNMIENEYRNITLRKK